MEEISVGSYVLVGSEGREQLRGKVFIVSAEHNCQSHKVILSIPVYGWGAGIEEKRNLQVISAERAAAILRSSIVPQSESFRQEPIATQLALVIYNIARCHDIKAAERIMEQNLHLFAK